MPKRFLSRSASAERASPCPLSQMIWAMVQPAGWPYSLAFERRLHHLHGHVRGEPLEGRPRRRVVPEPEDRAGQLGHGERREDEAQRPGEDAGEGPRRGRRGGPERPPRPFLRGRARRRPGGLPRPRLSGAGGDPGAPRPEPGRLLRGGPGRPPRPFARRLALSRRPRVRARQVRLPGAADRGAGAFARAAGAGDPLELVGLVRLVERGVGERRLEPCGSRRLCGARDRRSPLPGRVGGGSVRAAPACPGPPLRRGAAASEGGGGPSSAGACGEAVLAGHQPGAHRVRPPHRGDLRGARALSPGEGLRGSPRSLGPLYPSAFPAHGSPSSPARPRARRLNSSSRLRAAISSGFGLKRS